MQTNFILSEGRAIADLVNLNKEVGGYPAYLVTRINVPLKERGLGRGRLLLRTICEEANAEQVTLLVEPTPSGGLNMTQLLTWYRRYGFEGTPDEPLVRLPGKRIPAPRTADQQEQPACVGCGEWGPTARLEELTLGNPTEGKTVVGYCCQDCAERFRKIILARYPALVRAWGQANAIDVVNRRSRTLGRQ